MRGQARVVGAIARGRADDRFRLGHAKDERYVRLKRV